MIGKTEKKCVICEKTFITKKSKLKTCCSKPCSRIYGRIYSLVAQRYRVKMNANKILIEELELEIKRLGKN